MYTKESKELEEAQFELRELRILCSRDILDADLWDRFQRAQDRVLRASSEMNKKNMERR